MAESHAACLSLIVVLAAVLADIGWVLIEPALGVPAMLVALMAQVAVVAEKHRVREDGMVHEWAQSAWILGAAVWMCSEYLWGDGLRVAAFADRLTGGDRADASFKADVLGNRELYPASLLIACLTLWTTLAALVAVLMHRELWRWRCGVAKPPRDASEDLVLGLPMHIYCDLWFAPWLFMEACWAVNDLQMVLHWGVRPLFWLGVAGGLAAVLLCADCVQRYVQRQRHAEAVLCSAHLAWVAGNFAWYVFDVERAGESQAARAVPVSLFLMAIAFLGLSALLEAPEPRMAAAMCKEKTPLSERTPLLAPCSSCA